MGAKTRSTSVRVSQNGKENREAKEETAIVRITIDIAITPQQAARAFKLIAVALIALNVR